MKTRIGIFAVIGSLVLAQGAFAQWETVQNQEVSGRQVVKGNSDIGGNQTVAGTSAVTGAQTVGGALTVTGDLTAANLSTVILAAQSDTNAITLLTAYTPRRVGDVLIGYSNASNWVWIARGVTTNDWQQIAP
jgi:hypothetical protein